jgi:hypothetical protein
MLVADLRHFMAMPDDTPAPARKLGEQLESIVRAGTAGPVGQRWVTALACPRRPQRRRCEGRIEVVRSEVPPTIQWVCNACEDEGVISGWESSYADLRSPTAAPNTGWMQMVITDETAVALRSLRLLDTETERLVFRARSETDGIVLEGPEEIFDELVDSLAAEANHEQDRRRQKRLDAAFNFFLEHLDAHRGA